jgi:uncharacterized protein (TIGR01777 family)
MKLLLTGAGGFLGSALAASLGREGHRVLRVSRGVPRGPDDVRWDPVAGTIDREPLEGADAAVHLAGESVGERRWSDAQKARIRDSRVAGTRLLAGAIAALARPPRVLISASGVGYYGDRGDELLNESSVRGRGFLSDLAQAWEAETAPAEARGVRVVRLRIGMVLDGAGGALPRLIAPFRLGLGGPLGSGRQWVSWIALDDLIAAVRHVLANDALAGAVNAVSPQPVTQRDFARALGRALHRPARLAAPGFALRLLLGRERADALLLASQRAVPERLLETGFGFGAPTLDAALARALRARGGA